MYLRHFGFARDPFAETLEADELFESKVRAEAGARIRHLLELRGIGLLTGEVGCGKTTACRHAVSTLHAGLYRVRYVALTTGSVLDIYNLIAWQFGLQPERSRAAAYHAVRTEISRLAREAKQLPVLVIDEAQHLRPDILEELRLLSNFAMDSENRFCLLLIGLTELRRRLSMAVCESLSQRLVVRCHLGGLEGDEIEPYLRHRLRLAGAADIPIFEPNALRALPLEAVASSLGYRRDLSDKARWKRQGSVLSINGARFFDHLRGCGGGGAIDLAMHARGCGFPEAVRFLAATGRCAVAGEPPPERRRRTGLQLPVRADRSWTRVRDHLVERRGLDAELVDDCNRRGLIYADRRMNAVFVARNAAGIVTGAEISGIQPRPGGSGFKGMAPGSRKARGGFWLTADADAPASALLAESALDALSAMSIPAASTASAVMSTAGLSTAVPPWLQAFGFERIFCGYDADSAGDDAAAAMARSDPRVRRIRPEGAKDWNDMLRKAGVPTEGGAP